MWAQCATRRACCAAQYTSVSRRFQLQLRPEKRIWHGYFRVYAPTPPRTPDARPQPQSTAQGEATRESAITESIKPESIQKKAAVSAAKENVLLAEQTVSTKEQRKADWAIMKEMSRYLWPKVGIRA